MKITTVLNNFFSTLDKEDHRCYQLYRRSIRMHTSSCMLRRQRSFLTVAIDTTCFIGGKDTLTG